MKKLILILILSLFTVDAYAEKAVVKNDDGSVVIVHYVPGSFDSFEEVITSMGYDASKAEMIDDSAIPKDRTDRDFWTWNKLQKKIIVDQDKKQAHLDKIAAKKSKKDAVLLKLGITEKEFEELTDQEAV